MADIHVPRRKGLAAALREQNADAALITKLVNIRYLTGFTGSHAALLVTADGVAVLATDGRYELQAAEEAGDVELIVDRQVASSLIQHGAKHGANSIAFEAHDVTVELHQRLLEDAGATELRWLGHAVEGLRTSKDEDEIELLRTACRITDRAYRNVLGLIEPGITEREIAHAIEEYFVEYGADGPAFPSIVASGPNGARPHHQPDERRIARGDLVVMDIGARYRGYHADMTRTVAVGEPAEWQRDIYDLVAEAQRAGRESLVPGKQLSAVDGAARSVIRDRGHDDHFPHGLGHGVGLEIHERPYLSRSATGTLPVGVPVTVEPGVYLPGRGGVRIEDTLVVRAEGPELLTTASKELLVL